MILIKGKSRMLITYTRILNILTKRKISQAELCRQVGINKNTLKNTEKGDLKSDNLAAIATFLNVSTDYLLGITDQETAYPVSLKVSEKTLELLLLIYSLKLNNYQIQIIIDDIEDLIAFGLL